jgi:hypothetical protein
MSEDSIQQAAQALRLYLSVGADSAERAEELSTLTGHIYSDQLRPVRSDDLQEAIDEVCQRFSDLLQDHLGLESALLLVASHVTGRAPEDLLDAAVAFLRSRYR